MGKINVLFISIYDPSKGGSGPGNHIRYLSEALSEVGCEVHVLVNGPETKTININKISLHYFKCPILPKSGFFFSIFAIKKINELIYQYNINIVHGQSPSSYGYALLTRKKIPFVVTLHGTSFGELTSFSNIPKASLTSGVLRDSLFIQPLTTFLTNIEYRFANRIIAVSESIAHEAKQYYRLPEEKITVIHNGINPSEKSPEKTANDYSDRTILFVGRLIWRKGLKYLIDALPEIKSNYPQVKLIIIGSGDQRTAIENLVNSQKLGESVEFFSGVSDEELFELYAKADVYVQPSLYEPLGIAIMEAMSRGKAVVASNVGGIPELITNGQDGLLVEPGNVEQLSKAVIKLLSDPILRKKFGVKAQEKINKEFNWKKIAQKTLNLYQTATSK